jgi:molybdate transport system substrate-binding protein
MAAADGIYFPDPALATAGIHFAKVLDGLGLGEAAKPLSRVFPNGATAMRALAASADKRPIGCTQITEIVATPGITLVGPLPAGFELVTTYTAGVCSRGDRQNLARRFAALIAAPEATETRRRLGFEG